MVEALCGKRFVVIDDFLEAGALARLRQLVSSLRQRPVDSVVDARVDGIAMRSRGGVIRFDDLLHAEGFGEAMEAIRGAVASHPEIHGEAGVSWNTLSFAAWEYGAGTRLGWHDDTGHGRTGEFIFYLHEQWRPSWGGELFLLDETYPVEAQGTANDGFAVIEDLVARSHAPLTAIRPRPNRLVLLRAGTCHCISRVDVAAGLAKRRSLTGFSSLPTRATPSDRQKRLDAIQSLTKRTHGTFS